MLKTTPRPMLLMILDGWGYSESTTGNAILAARKPNFDALWQKHPHTLLAASGLDVGLPRGQMGNSEVGHLHIGAGRLVMQDLTKIDHEIATGAFFSNAVFNSELDKVLASNSKLHILGLLSAGGVHSRNTHIEAMVELAAGRGVKEVYVHAFLDGRDTPPQSAAIYLKSLQAKMQTLACGKIASICGRYYAMDRDKRWERVQAAYNLLTLGKEAFHEENVLAALASAYTRGETDEFVKPTVIHAASSLPYVVQDNDALIFMNFRADRGRELSYAFTATEFTAFKREAFPKLSTYVTMTQYAADIQAEVVYPSDIPQHMLGEVIATHGLTQLRIAETEKYAHVTYFINGGREQPFPHEDRILVPSPKVATYDLAPTMSVLEVTDKLITAIRLKKYDLIICNYANPDMLGHTGSFAATVYAIETVDQCLGRLIKGLQEVNGELVVVADHGNAEVMVDPVTQQPHTAHTTNQVPFIYMGRKAIVTSAAGKLTDVAPTLLYLMDIEKPQYMIGKTLVALK